MKLLIELIRHGPTPLKSDTVESIISATCAQYAGRHKAEHRSLHPASLLSLPVYHHIPFHLHSPRLGCPLSRLWAYTPCSRASNPPSCTVQNLQMMRSPRNIRSLTRLQPTFSLLSALPLRFLLFSTTILHRHPSSLRPHLVALHLNLPVALRQYISTPP
jgi:hypothetical protein